MGRSFLFSGKPISLRATCSVDTDVSVITVNEMKLIRGVPGDSRTIGFPAPSPTPVPLGKTGAVVEPGTDHVRSIETGKPIIQLTCHPYCLFNLTADLVEQNDLVNDTRLVGWKVGLRH